MDDFFADWDRGFCGKAPARVGDAAILGAGTWAHPLTWAVSATGAGEPFLRVLFAHQIHMRMLHGGQDLATAARDALAVVGDTGGSAARSASPPTSSSRRP